MPVPQAQHRVVIFDEIRAAAAAAVYAMLKVIQQLDATVYTDESGVNTAADRFAEFTVVLGIGRQDWSRVSGN